MNKYLLFSLLFFISCQHNHSEDCNHAHNKQEEVTLTIPSIELDNNKLIIGDWIYSKELFLEKQKELQKPAIDMSIGFDKIEMTFFKNGEYISYLNDQVTKGTWSIDDSLITFEPINKQITSSEFEIINNNLYIYVPTGTYDALYILAFHKK